MKVWQAVISGLGWVAAKLDRAVLALEDAQLWASRRAMAGRLPDPPRPPLHHHHVHVSSAWPEVARFRPPAEDR